MNRFTLDDISSSPVSERLPPLRQQRQNVFSDDIASTTPAVPPPSQLFGSSQFSGVSKLRFQPSAQSLLKFSTTQTTNSRTRLPRKGRADVVPGLARDVSTRSVAPIEPDDVILGTEQIVRTFDQQVQEHHDDLTAIADTAARQLIRLWRNGSRSTPLGKAQHLATLLFELHQANNIPDFLLAWLDRNHINYEPLYEQVMGTSPAPSANELYWDAVESFTLRGKFEQVMELLRKSDLNHAVIDTPEGTKSANFSGIQLQQAEDAVYRARQLINTCPAFHDDWELDGQDWAVYRKQLESEIEHLADQVPGLPFVIYQRLKTVYSIMLGDADEIIGLAQDWLEASFLLTVWYPTDSYLERLRDSFLCVTDPDSETGFQLNTMDATEIGLGAILQNDVQSCLQVLQSLSLCITSSVMEVGTWAGWITSYGLDQEDLLVLNYGSNDTSIQRDDVLAKYAATLFDKDLGDIEGWELSFSILSRLDDQERMHVITSEMLQNLSVSDQGRTEKLVEICEQFGLEEEGRKVSENFADNLINTTSEYGTALLCYARAHADQKVRQLIDLLNSYCLVQSKAYPPEMDSSLTQLVDHPKSALQGIASADPRAAEILQFYLAGYACIRRFYTLRDGRLPPIAKNKAVAKALVAAINSAADCIYGGLYDPKRQSAIQVDGLLTMLGEATALDGAFSSNQLYAILAVIEDLQTVNHRVYQATEQCMEASLRNYHGSSPPSPHDMLKKSFSSGTNSNFSFSLMGSEMLARSDESLVGQDTRVWDWRAKFKDQGTGTNVLQCLRYNVARELSTAMLQ